MSAPAHAVVATPLRDDPGYREAADRVEQLLTEQGRIEAETASIDAAARSVRATTALTEATRVLAGDNGPQESERRSALVQRAALMRRALPEAVEARGRAARVASAAYMRGQAPRVVAAYDKLVQAFEQVLAASDLFEAVRRDAAALGFDSEVGVVPAGADTRFREYAQHWSHELRKELAALRGVTDRAA